MKEIIYDRQGNLTEDITKAAGALFEGNDAVESSVLIIDDEYDPNVSHYVHYDEFHPILGQNNISIFIDPKEKLFNILARTDNFDGKQIGTSMSFTGEEYDQFISLMKKVIDQNFGSKLNCQE